jgi:type II secretory pathway pseudopilin PulG
MRHSKGFTIAELAVAAAILALLLFGAMVPFSAQVDIRNVAETRRTMDSIREALLGFAQANGRLPCAADGSIAAGLANAGVERFNGTSCNPVAFTSGVIPWVTLGVQETDAWGRRFSYRVSPAFADAVSLTTWNTRASAYAPPAGSLAQAVSTPPSPADQSQSCDVTAAPALASFALCTLGDIAVFTRTTSQAVPLGTALPAVFISHGKNGFGAWQPSGIRLPVAAAGTDEAANASGTPTQTPVITGGYTNWAYYSRTPMSATSGCVDPAPPGPSASPPCEFDDFVVMIPSNVLVARMIAAGRLP